eukprot:3723733-Pyramimonas_sp.AAC.1
MTSILEQHSMAWDPLSKALTSISETPTLIKDAHSLISNNVPIRHNIEIGRQVRMAKRLHKSFATASNA